MRAAPISVPASSRCLRQRRECPPAAPKRTPLPSRWPRARRGSASGAFASTPRIEPGALDAGDVALKVGYGSKQRRPDFEGSVLGGAIVNRRVIAQGGPVEPSGDATGAQISLGRCAGKWASCTKQAARRFGRAARCWWRMIEIRRPWDRGTGQGEKAARFVHGLAEIAQVAVEADQIKQIAMLAGLAASVHLPAAPGPDRVP